MEKQNNIELREELQNRILEQMDVSRDLKDEEIYETIDQVMLLERKEHPISLTQMKQFRQSIFNSLRKLDVLQELIDDDEITEIMVNAYDDIFIEKDGCILKSEKKFLNKEKYEDVIQKIVAGTNRIVNASTPIVDARLADGSRVNVVLEPIAIDGSSMTIRKFFREGITMERLLEFHSVDQNVCKFLKIVVECGYNIMISGGTGSGKTTFLNAMSEYIPREERIVTIEDSAELQLRFIQNLVRLETRNANVEGKNAISIKELLKASLRMRPNRILVGEVRGEEALYMLQAMNTGHDGSISTCHANSCEDALSRIETMVLMGEEIPFIAVRGQIASAIDLVIQLGRLRDRSRKMLEIAEIIGMKGDKVSMHTIFRFEEKGEKDGKIYGQWSCIDPLFHTQKIKYAGRWEEYESILS